MGKHNIDDILSELGVDGAESTGRRIPKEGLRQPGKPGEAAADDEPVFSPGASEDPAVAGATCVSCTVSEPSAHATMTPEPRTRAHATRERRLKFIARLH